MSTRIVLADDHPIFLAGLRNLIADDPGFTLLGEATSGLAALRLITHERPDVAIVDISMPELNGLLLSRRLAQECRAVRVIVLTLHEDRAYLKQAIDAGVAGYLLKRSAAELLLPAIRAVIVGGLYVDPLLAKFVTGIAPSRAGRAVAAEMDLTERETEVLKLSALGFSNKEIARRLDISVKTVETHKQRATEKLGLKSRAALVSYAAVQGWFSDA